MFLLLALNISNSFLVKIDFYFFPKNPQLVLLLHLMRQIPSFMLMERNTLGKFPDNKNNNDHCNKGFQKPDRSY